MWHFLDFSLTFFGKIRVVTIVTVFKSLVQVISFQANLSYRVRNLTPLGVLNYFTLQEICIHTYIFLYICAYFLYLVAENRKVISVGDTIIKDLTDIQGVTVKAFPGSTIGRLGMYISNGEVDLEDFNYIVHVVYVGRNNIGKRNILII